MKALSMISLVAALFVSNLQAASSYDVRVSSEKEKIHINFTTKATHSSMCGLQVTRLELQAPVSQNEVTRGEIEMEVRVNPFRPCLMAFGPHRGSVTLSRGYSLPELSLGKYALSINGEAYGTLVVKKDSVSLID
jgi:hypothetical protein